MRLNARTISHVSLLAVAIGSLAQAAHAQTATQPQASSAPSPQDRLSPPPQEPAATAPAPQAGQTDSTMAGAAPTAEPSGTSDEETDIVVTGYRQSLAQSTQAKRNATGFSDSIFAEDIGKFPDTNIAESFNRIPGITISRDINGQGANVAIRGLGSNFTQVTLNGAPIAIASAGIVDAQGTDRSVDLSFFPTDLFTKLTVNKSYTADLLEGGAAGNIDIRSARPFDRPGNHLAFNLQTTKQSRTDRWGGRGSLIASATSGTLGILGGIAIDRQESRVPGYETIGWTNPNLSTPDSIARAAGRTTPTAADITAAQCRVGACNGTGGGNFTIPGVVPANAGNGLTSGTVLNQDALLALNPGLSIQQIDNAIIPRLGGPVIADGTRDRINGVVSAEWRPSDALHVYVDGMFGYRRYDYKRTTSEWIVRNGAPIPIGMTVDRQDCSQGCVATGGTFANAQFYSVYRPYRERNRFWGVNPGAEWQIADDLKLDVQANYTRSTFSREVPSVLVVTRAGSGVTVDYANNGGIPTVSTNVDLNDPSSYVWNGGRLNIQDERRVNKTKGFRGDLTWGGERLNLKVGGNYDDVSRRITAYDNSQAWQNAVCGNNPSVFLPSPNGQPPCEGLSAPGAAPTGYPSYPGYGTGSTAGATGPVTYGGSLVPQSALGGYLVPGPDGFVNVDWSRFRQASNYDFFHDNAPVAGSANTGASGGYIREQSPSLFAEVNGAARLGESDLRFNVGLRWVHTKQTIAGLVSLPDPRNVGANGAQIPDGSRYPNITNTVATKSSYSKWLPAANVAYDVGEHAVARAAISRTMTRPDPTAQLPGANFSVPSADVATIGNPALSPYMSTNIDLGFEYYTGQEGVISFNAFRKAITGFTANGITTTPFSDLAVYGITFDTLTPTQQAAINSRGGAGAATVAVQQQVNASGTLKVNGLEFQWVQPLDFLLERFGVRGLGFQANATIVDQKGSGAAPATALGVAPWTYNAIIYYERHGVSIRVSDTFRKGAQGGALNQNSIGQAGLYSDDYSQWDLSTIFDLQKIGGWKGGPQITFDIVNFTNSKLRSYFQFENATFTEYRPGRQFLVGIRGSF
jgi:TonB-dependent receptor